MLMNGFVCFARGNLWHEVISTCQEIIVHHQESQRLLEKIKKKEIKRVTKSDFDNWVGDNMEYTCKNKA